MTEFTPISGLAGGLMIGLAAVLLLGLNGRIAGISGIIGGLLPPRATAPAWRLSFLAGLFLGALAFAALNAQWQVELPLAWPWMILAGLLVGFGTRLGSGCTSGHGVCGIARLSPRSCVATGVFMLSAALTVFVIRHGISS